MHHPQRATPTLWGFAGAVCTIGAVATTARFIDNYTGFTIVQPFDGLTFGLAVAGLVIGPAMIAWLRGVRLRQTIAELREENRALRENHRRFEQLSEDIRRCDEQAEVSTVLMRKVLKILEDGQIPVGDTQEIPRRHLHGINGGGSA